MERVRIRELRKEDSQKYFEWINNRELVIFNSAYSPISEINCFPSGPTNINVPPIFVDIIGNLKLMASKIELEFPSLPEVDINMEDFFNLSLEKY